MFTYVSVGLHQLYIERWTIEPIDGKNVPDRHACQVRVRMFALGEKKGPMSRYRDEHLVYLMMLLRAEGRMSRRSISERIGIGEGSVRSALAHLASEGMVETNRRGVALTEGGCGFLDGLGFTVVPMGSRGDIAMAFVVVRGAADGLGDGIRHMFAAVKAGAEDVSLYRVDGGMVPVQAYAPDLEADGLDLDTMGCTSDGDAVVVCGSGTVAEANLAAVAAGIGIRMTQQRCA